MGLDQNWLKRDLNEGEEWDEFYYHRKVPALEAFMAEKWQALGNEGRFNCEILPVTSEILDELQDKVTNKTLNHDASGFFWGSHYDEDYEQIQEAINEARELLAEEWEVAYSSWW